MEALGTILVSIGIWVTYCGALGIPPVETFTAIIADPANARQIIAQASSDAMTKAQVVSPETYAAGNAVGLFSKYTVSCDWACHLKRGTSLGGIDYVMPVGTPLFAPFDGTAQFLANNGTLGHIMTVTSGDGYKSVYAHISQAKVTNGAKVKFGEVVALSGGAKGAAGSGSSTGPHVHWHMVTPLGLRISPLEYFKDK